MSENIRAISLDRPAPYDAWLILNETAAIAFVPPSQARILSDRYRKSGLACSHLPGDCGPDVIDFGSPSAEQERLIRTVFDSWRRDVQMSEESPPWYVWLSLLVVALWVVAEIASW